MIREIHRKLSASLLGAVALTVGLLAVPTLHANVVNIDTAGITTYGEFGDPTNTVLNFNIGSNSHVTGIGFDVTLTAFDPSYLSEITVSFTPSDPDLAGVFLTPGVGDNTPGTSSYNSGGIIDLVGLGLDFNVSGDGTLRVEFFEGFQDDVNPNGLFNSGTLSVQYDTAVPEPSSWALLGLGGLGVCVVLRRRRAA